jgi:hypothetical protein
VTRITTPATRLGYIVAAAGLLFICGTTLVPRPEQTIFSSATPFFCLVCGDLGMIDVILNLILFMPFGFGLAWAGVRFRRVVAAGFAVTFFVEAMQFSIITGRDSSLSDLVTNSAGAAAGALLAIILPTLLRPQPAQARWLVRGGALALTAVLAATSWAMTPSLPRTIYWGQQAPALTHLKPFLGRVLTARLGGENLPEGRLGARASDTVRTRLTEGDQLEAEAVPAGATPGLAPILSIFDLYRREIALLGQSDRDLVFRVRAHAQDALVRGPAIRLPEAFPASGEHTLHLTGSMANGVLEVSRTGPTETLRRSVALGPGLGWSLVLPFEYAFGPEEPLLTALWLAGLLLPLGYWAAWSYRRGRSAAGAAAIFAGALVIGLALTPLAFGLPAVAWSQWLASLAGLALGWALGRLAQRREVAAEEAPSLVGS